MLLDIFNVNIIYYNEFHYFCQRNCIRQILEYYKVKDALFYISSYPDTIFVENKNFKFRFKLVNNSNNMPVLPKFMDNIKIYQNNSKVYINIWEKYKEILENEIPLILILDTYYLKYRPEYKKIHGAHSIILSGYSRNEEEMYIIDWYEPYFYKGVIQKDILQLAMLSENPFNFNPFSGFHLNNSWLIVERNNWNENIDELIYNTLCNSLNVPYSFKLDTDTKIYSGINSLKKVYQVLVKYLQADIKIKAELLKYIHENLYITFTTRRLFQFYLDSAQKNTGRNFKQLILILDDLNKKYDRFLSTLLRRSFSKTEEGYKNIINDLRELIKLETEMFNNINVIKNNFYKE